VFVQPARSPVGNPAGVTFEQRVPLIATASLFFEIRRGHSPVGQKSPVNRHDLKHTQPSRTPPAPNYLYSIVFCHRAGLRGSHDLVGGAKRQEGGGLCAIQCLLHLVVNSS
jgi:hypothetical protein